MDRTLYWYCCYSTAATTVTITTTTTTTTTTTITTTAYWSIIYYRVLQDNARIYVQRMFWFSPMIYFYPSMCMWWIRNHLFRG